MRVRASTAVLSGLAALCAIYSPAGTGSAESRFQTELFEDLPSDWHTRWSFEGLTPALKWSNRPWLAVGTVPDKLSPAGLSMYRESPFSVRLTGGMVLSGGDYEFVLRSRMKARLYVDNRLVLSSDVPPKVVLTPEQIAQKEAEDKKAREAAANQEAEREALLQKLEDAGTGADEATRIAIQAELDKVRESTEKSDKRPPPKIQTLAATVPLESGKHLFRLEVFGPRLAGEVSVVFRRGSDPLKLLSASTEVRFTEKAWAEWQEQDARIASGVLEAARKPLTAAWEKYWRDRHDTARTKAHAEASPGFIDLIINAKLAGAGVSPAAPTDDYEFVRRVYLDAWGVIPTAAEVQAFVGGRDAAKRSKLVDRLLTDARWADTWVSYWEDVLAENPRIFGEVPNSTGPFKTWIYRSFVEDSGYDRFATELILMEGSNAQGGTMGFRESKGNDLPPAEKAHVVAQAFMAANMRCARCHDSPVNEFKQRDLFGIGALLEGKPLIVPETSSVGEVPGRRKPAVVVTSKPGDRIPFTFVFDPGRAAMAKPADARASRAALAEWITEQQRFAQVGVNRVWKRLMGAGLVEPVDNWPRTPKISHPELMDALVNEFQRSGYSVRHLQKLIMQSAAYGRKRDHALSSRSDSNGLPLFAALPVRRMRAEEIVDSLHRTVGREFKSERMAYASVDYGFPKRTWQLVTLSNEEDNAILVRPVLQELITAASAFGWRDQRPDPVSVRNEEPHPLQALTMANGALINRLIRLTDSSFYTSLAQREITRQEFVNTVLLNTLSRPPSGRESEWFEKQLAPVWDNRRVAVPPEAPARSDAALSVQYKDMLDAYRYIAESRKEEPATRGLTESFRKKFETALWVILNSPEFLFVP